MLASNPISTPAHDHEFFDTLKRYAQRLNEEKNISLSYLQTINKLSVQMSQKDELIQKLLKQNSELRQKLSLYEQVMTRSRILVNANNTGYMGTNNPVTNPSPLKQQTSIINNLNNNYSNNPNLTQKNNLFSPSYSNMKITNLIEKEKITESFLETRNELEYLKEYDEEEYRNKLENRVKVESVLKEVDEHTLVANVKGNLAIGNPSVLNPKPSYRFLPLFQDFVILKPTQNTSTTAQTLQLVFSLSPQPPTRNSKLHQSLATYLCHNSGSHWLPQQYKPLNSPQTHTQQQLFIDNLFIYLSNSQQTIQPVIQSSQSTQPLSPIYLDFNPSVYYFGIAYRSHTLEYINNKLFKIPLVYSFVTRYPFVEKYREMLEVIVERLDVKNQHDMAIFKKELMEIKDKSGNSHDGIFVREDFKNINSQVNTNEANNPTFKFQLLQKHFSWPKLPTKLPTQPPATKSPKRMPRQRSLTSQPSLNGLTSPSTFSILPTKDLFPLFNPFPNLILSELSTTFTSYNIQLIIDVLLLLLLQIPITVVSRSQSLLQKFMLYFVYIIKPLKYPFPIIFNLPANMSIVLESPFPSFLGITDHKVIEPYMFERTVFDLDEKIAKSWPNIDFYNQSRQCIVAYLNKILDKQQTELMKLQKINEIVKILITSSKYYPQQLKQLRTYRKYFKKTQIWHLYSHSQQEKNSQLGYS